MPANHPPSRPPTFQSANCTPSWRPALTTRCFSAPALGPNLARSASSIGWPAGGRRMREARRVWRGWPQQRAQRCCARGLTHSSSGAASSSSAAGRQAGAGRRRRQQQAELSARRQAGQHSSRRGGRTSLRRVPVEQEGVPLLVRLQAASRGSSTQAVSQHTRAGAAGPPQRPGVLGGLPLGCSRPPRARHLHVWHRLERCVQAALPHVAPGAGQVRKHGDCVVWIDGGMSVSRGCRCGSRRASSGTRDDVIPRGGAVAERRSAAAAVGRAAARRSSFQRRSVNRGTPPRPARPSSRSPLTCLAELSAMVVESRRAPLVTRRRDPVVIAVLSIAIERGNRPPIASALQCRASWDAWERPETSAHRHRAVQAQIGVQEALPRSQPPALHAPAALASQAALDRVPAIVTSPAASSHRLQQGAQAVARPIEAAWPKLCGDWQALRPCRLPGSTIRPSGHRARSPGPARAPGPAAACRRRLPPPPPPTRRRLALLLHLRRRRHGGGAIGAAAGGARAAHAQPGSAAGGEGCAGAARPQALGLPALPVRLLRCCAVHRSLARCCAVQDVGRRVTLVSRRVGFAALAAPVLVRTCWRACGCSTSRPVASL